MIYISHRGNLTGKNPELENTPEYINTALAKGYHCEVDVFEQDGVLLLGHDDGQTPIDIQFLRGSGIIAHAKNLEAFATMLQHNVHCFFHNTDAYTLTSRNWIWAYPDQPGTLSHPTIAVLPEQHNTDVSSFDGICSDLIEQYKNDQTSSI